MPTKRSKKWFISVLDNPKFNEEELKDLIQEFRAISSSEAEFQARLNGQWMSMDSAVFHYDSEKNWSDLDDYDPRIWPHVLVVDPAASGMAGISLFAREPNRDVWHCVLARYMKGTAFSRMVPDIEEMVAPFNIVKRICDCNPSGFYKEAHLQGVRYKAITDKSFNKENMIDAVNAALAQEIVYLTKGAEVLADELLMCSRSEENPERILKSSKYHTADTLRYFVHLKPKFETVKAEPRPEERTRRAWKEKLQKDAKRDKMRVRTRMRQMRPQGRSTWAG
jgi:hypothetical protein